jgi:hypothetical protein
MSVAVRKILGKSTLGMEPVPVTEELKAAIVGTYEAIKWALEGFDPICRTYRREVERLRKDQSDVNLCPEHNYGILELHVHLAERLVRYLLTPTEAPSCYPPRGHADYVEELALSRYRSDRGLHHEVQTGIERSIRSAHHLVNEIDAVRRQHQIPSIQRNPGYWAERERQQQLDEDSLMRNNEPFRA